MPFVFKVCRHPILVLSLAAMPGGPACAQLVCCDGFADYAADSRLADGAGGAGWDGPYYVANNIKHLMRIENRASFPAVYMNGEILIPGGDRALRFYDAANGSYAVRRSPGATFQAAAGETLWFGFLFRTSNASPLASQDFFQVGFDSDAAPANGVPRVSIGANTTSTDKFPAPFRFFARSTAAADASAFCGAIDIQAATTYLLVGSVRPNDEGRYGSVSLFVNPSSLADPGPPCAAVELDSGLTTLAHLFIRTAYLDNADAYVIDELRVARDYPSIVQTLRDALKILPANQPGGFASLRWPASLTGAVLETSPTLAPDSWSEAPGPQPLDGAQRTFAIPNAPAFPQKFYRLRQ